MSEARQPPADMLLLRERQRRMRARALDAPTHDDDELLIEADEIVGEPFAAESASRFGEALSLYRPLGQVSLAHMSWSGAVDHDELQNAILCSPPRGATGAQTPGWLAAVMVIAPPDASGGEAALHVSLGDDETAALSRIGSRLPRAEALALIRAAALPSTIVRADAATVNAAAGVVSAYRHAALVHAWQAALCGSAPADTARERDAAAVRLISMLRALLGEV